MKISDIRALPESWEKPETPAQTIYRKFPHDLIDYVKNRMQVGYYRYCAGRRSVINEQACMEPTEKTAERLLSKFIQFVHTGNLEFLVDVVTYSCLIWRWGSWPWMHFVSVERHEVEELKNRADFLASRLMRVISDDMANVYYHHLINTAPSAPAPPPPEVFADNAAPPPPPPPPGNAPVAPLPALPVTLDAPPGPPLPG